MTPLHEGLFQLLCEIDDICRENNITYYLHCGSVIGAVRHHGIIPWDDDIDIAITRSNWEKLKPLLENTPIKNRTLVLPEKYEQYHFPYPQYKNTATSVLYHSGAFPSFPMGVFIDILILDPVQEDSRILNRHTEALKLMAELRSDNYVINRQTNWKKYRFCRIIEKFIGRKKIIDYLTKELESVSEQNCDGYVQRVGIFPTYWDKRYFSEPAWIEMKGRLFPVPTHTEEYLRYTYGDSWMKYPSKAGKANHGFLAELDYNFSTIQKDYRPYINVRKTQDGWRRYKYWRIRAIAEEDRIRLCNSKRMAALKALAVTAQTQRTDIKNLLQEHKYPELEAILSDYLQTQLSSRFVKDEIAVPVDDKTFYVACMVLILRGDYDKADTIVKCNHGMDRDEGLLFEVNEAIQATRELSVSFYEHKRNWEEISTIVEKNLPLYPHHVDFIVAKCNLLLQQSHTIEHVLEVIRICEDELSYHPGCDMLLKILADAEIKLGNQEKALSICRKIYKETTNGLLRLELEEYWTANQLAEPDEELAEPLENSLHEKPVRIEEEIQDHIFNLICELDEICQGENIPYFLGGYLAAEAVDLGEFKPGCCSANIVMHPADRTRFRKAVLNHLQPGRILESYENNSHYPDFSMRYCDTNTVYFDLRSEGFYRFHGVRVTIYFVSPEPRAKLFQKFCVGLYAAVEAIAYPSVFDNQSKKKTIAGCMAKIASVICGRKILKKIAWQLIYQPWRVNSKIKGTIKDFWYKRISLPAIDFSKANYCSLKGKTLPIPTNYAAYIKPQISSKWYIASAMNFKLSLPFLAEMNVSCGEFLKCLETLNLKSQYSRALKRLSYCNKSCSEESKYTVYSWNIMLRSADRLKMYKQYMPIKEQIIEYHRNGDYDALKETLSDYIAAVRANDRRAKALVFDSEIFWITCDLLQRNGETALVARLLPRVPAAHLRPMNYSCGRVNEMQKAVCADKEQILSYLEKDIENCLYMYADISKYGVNAEHITVWYDTDLLGPRMVVMKYHDNFQVYANRGFENVEIVLELVAQEKPRGISARKEIITQLAGRLTGTYTAEYGVIFKGKPISKEKLERTLVDCDIAIEQAFKDDAPGIAHLLCMDSEFRSIYTEESLAQELEDRMQTGMGRSYIIRSNGQIVAHNATYAECDRFVVISGMMVHPDYRDTEYAYWVDIKSSLEFQEEGKDRYFFALKDNIIRWHKRVGAIPVAQYGKMSQIQKFEDE